MYRLFIIIILLKVFSCSESGNTHPDKLSFEQKENIEKFSHKLIEGINNYDVKIINNHWSNTGFLKQISTVSGTEQSLLNHIFEKELKKTIKVDNVSLIHQIKDTHAKVSFLSLHHFIDYSELTILLNFNTFFNFYKFRIEYINNKPVLTDYTQIKENLWYSERISKVLNVNVKYNAFSEERHQANWYYNSSLKLLNDQDTLGALRSLYQIPASHQELGLSELKINLALNLGDSIYSNVLVTEHEKNKSLYIKYLYNLYFSDSTQLNKVYEDLFKVVGTSKQLDSLIHNGSYWF